MEQFHDGGYETRGKCYVLGQRCQIDCLSSALQAHNSVLHMGPRFLICYAKDKAMLQLMIRHEEVQKDYSPKKPQNCIMRETDS